MADQPETEPVIEKKPVFFMREPREVAPGEEKNKPFALLVLLGLFVLLWFGGGFASVIFVIGLILMIFLHELGHFLTARWTGMKATQFFLGMGPRLWSFRRGEVEYGLRAIPAGAFVRIVGMNNLDPVEDPRDAPRAYMNKSYPRRMLVITAGSLMHFLQALVLFAIAFTMADIPDDTSWQVGSIATLDESDGVRVPAEVVGIVPGDKVVSVNGQETTRFPQLIAAVQPLAGEIVTLEVLRADGRIEEFQVELAGIDDGAGGVNGFLGVGAEYTEFLSAADTFVETGRQMKSALGVIPDVFSPARLASLGNLMFEGSEEVAIDSTEASQRPISMVGVVRLAGSEQVDWVGRILLLGAINIFVGIVNLVPLLPLDGGHAAIATYERIRSGWRGRRFYRADVAKLMPLTYGVVGLLAFIFISTVWLDILRPIS